MSAGSANHILKRWDQRCENARVELEQYGFPRTKLQRLGNPTGTLFKVGRFHTLASKYVFMASTKAGTVDSTGTMSGFKPNSCAASRVTGPITARAVPEGSMCRPSGIVEGLMNMMQSTCSLSKISPILPA